MPKNAVGIDKIFNKFRPRPTNKQFNNNNSNQCIQLPNSSNSSILKCFRVFPLCQTLCKRKEMILSKSSKQLDGRIYLQAHCLQREITIRQELLFKIYNNQEKNSSDINHTLKQHQMNANLYSKIQDKISSFSTTSKNLKNSILCFRLQRISVLKSVLKDNNLLEFYLMNKIMLFVTTR